MNPSPNIIFVGPTGAGKTSMGRRVARQLGLRFIDADQEIERRTGATIATIFECEGEAGFRRREAQTIAALCDDRGLLIATGAGAVLDPDSRRRIAERGFVVHLKIEVDEQLRRLRRDSSRPLLQTPDREQRLRAMASERGPLYAQCADLVFEGGSRSYTRQLFQLCAAIEQHWQRPETT